MGFFTPEQAAALAQTTVRLGTLVDLDFEDAPKHLWNGHGRLDVGEIEYEGLAGLGSIEGLGYANDPASKVITLTLSGTNDVPLPDSILALALAEQDKIEGRVAVISFVLFDADWQLLTTPIEPIFGIMQRPKVTRTPILGEDGGQQLVSLPVENLFYGRARPPAGRYTDRDQQTRYPGDRFFSFVASLMNKRIVWPDF